MPLEAGTQLGPYEIVAPIGAGGMGEVYKARDTRLDRTVAIKVLPEHVASDPDLKQRFEREAKTISSLNHPHICTLYDIGSQDGIDFLVMEYLDGETLAQRLTKGALPLDQALTVAIEIADALDKAHRQGIVHRDLKPGNIMLVEQKHVKVMDFGLAKEVPSAAGPEAETIGALTEPGIRIGTPGYMAPEQLVGGTIDERSDIFAFGIVLYELLAGVHPFRRSSPSDTMSAILRETPVPVSQYAKDAPSTARVTLDRLLAKEPGERYQTFSDVRIDLGQVLREASGQIPVQTSFVGAATSDRTPFVERKSERAEGRRLLDRTIAGQGGVLLLGGEPGVGKTRLAEEILAEGRQRGCLALIGRCYETEGTPPFIPWVELVQQSARVVPAAAFRAALGDAAPEVAKLLPELRQRFSDIPSPIELPPEQQRRFLFSNFLEFLERGARITPHVLLLDDLHWADESTLLLLQHIAQHASDMPLLIVGTYRDVDLEVARPFAKVLEAFTRQRLAHRVALRRLPEAGVSEMLKALSGQAPPAHLVAAIYAETEGNPFFVEEVFQHLSEEGRLIDEDGQWRADLRVEDLEVPEGIRLVIGRRFERLSAEARRVLTTAATVGRSFDLTLLEAMGDAEGDALLTALEEAEAAKLVQTVSSGREVHWEFAHGLIRQTLENSLSLMRRQRAHLRVAEAMERIYGTRIERHAADVAQHLYQAGLGADPDKTVRFLTLAGDQALEAGAFNEALRLFTDASSIQEDGDDRRKLADLQYRKGLALRSLGRFEEAVDAWRPALASYEALDDLEGIARTAYDVAEQTSWLPGQARAAPDVARRALDLVGDRDAAARCRMLALLARFSSLAGDPYEDSRAPLVEAEALAARFDRPELTAEVLSARTRFHWSYGQLPQAIEIARRGMSVRRERGELYEVTELMQWVCLSALLAGRLREADEMAAELEVQAARVGNMGAGFVWRWCQVSHHFVTAGDLAASDERWGRLIEWCKQHNPAWLGPVHASRAWVRIYAGNWGAARGDHDTALRLDQPSFADGMVSTSDLMAGAYAGNDVLERLQAARSQALAMAEDNPLGLWELLVNVVEGLAVLGRRQEAADLHPLVVRGIEKGPAISLQCCRLWQMVAGIAAACGEHWDAAQEHYETALRQAHELPHKIAQPEVRRWYARMLFDRNAPGDRDKARTMLGEATEMYHTICMPKHLEMVEKMSAEL